MRERVFQDENYRAIYFGLKTIRTKIDIHKPMKELKYPEFYDVKITDRCNGMCPQCYQDSTPIGCNFTNLIDKFMSYFEPMSVNQRPFQIAIGGGEPTLHPQFLKLLEVSSRLGIVPNYTTNGMFTEERNRESIISSTKLFCGGVAVCT